MDRENKISNCPDLANDHYLSSRGGGGGGRAQTKKKEKKHDLGKFSAYSSALSLFESIALSPPLTYGRNVRHMIDHSNSFIFA